ncbi:ribonuclease T2-like [Podila epicladia]|nr:ribonuclease T2-like [Podila epicladia]
MKFISTTIVLGCAFLEALSALPASPLMPRRDTCPQNVLSCPNRPQNADTCCVPKHGRVGLAQQWHPQLGPMNEFTLHGLWPDNCDGSAKVRTCDRDRMLDDVEDRLKQTDLYDDMIEYWPSFKPTPQKPDYNWFWRHEWNAHGTCITTLDPKCGYTVDQGLYTYFNTTLTLRKRYNIYNALKKAGITPRPRFDREPREEDRYSVVKILDAIEKEWHVKGAVYCSPGNPLEL